MKFEYLVDKFDTRVSAADMFRHLFLASTHSYWLDSNRADGKYARFSFMGDDRGPYSHLISYRVGEPIAIRSNSGETNIQNRDIFSFLETALADSELVSPSALPFEFCGGYVGYLGYE